MRYPLRVRTAEELSNEGAPDIVLINRAKGARNQAPQPSQIARRVSIACDNPWPKDREALEAYPFDRFFF